jgi:cobalt-zinc-cadmium efflux system membrane fusion protein
MNPTRSTPAITRWSALALVATLTACGRTEPRREPVPAPAAEAGGPHVGPPIVSVDAAIVGSGRVVLAEASRRSMRGDLRLPAEISPSESGAADVGALIAGRVGTIEVHEGDAVKRGQVLAWVDSPEAGRVAAEVIRSRARVLAASRKLERQLGLEQDRATSPAAVDEARMDLATAQADAAAARTLLTSLGIPEPPAPAQGALAARVPVRSPIDGVVVERMATLGAPVSPDKTLFRVLARDHVVVDARWTDATSTPPPKDTVVKLLPRGGSGDAGASCTGKVTATVGLVDERTRARRVRIVPDGPCALLVPGAYIDAAFTSTALGAASAPVLALPKDAVVEVRGAPTVFVGKGKPGTFEAHVVRIGRTTSEDVAIEDGIADGDRVVVEGAVLLKGELLRSELESQ